MFVQYLMCFRIVVNVLTGHCWNSGFQVKHKLDRETHSLKHVCILVLWIRQKNEICWWLKLFLIFSTFFKKPNRTNMNHLQLSRGKQALSVNNPLKASILLSMKCLTLRIDKTAHEVLPLKYLKNWCLSISWETYTSQ